MKRENYAIMAELTFVALLLSLLMLPIETSAGMVWSDNFDDGDYTSSPEWTVRNGTFDCTDHVLNATGDSTPSGPTYDCFDNEIWINSTVSYGTWSFDLHFGGQSYYGPGVWFVSDVILEDMWVGTGWRAGPWLRLPF